MKHRLLFVGVVLFLLLVTSTSFAQTVYYVDPNAPRGGNGSFANPWNSIAQVNSHSFSTSDRLYFKVGTRLVMTAPLYVRWGGASGNRSVIGAYYGEGLFGLGPTGREYERPILDGNNHTVPAQFSWTGLIDAINTSGYTTIQDIEVRNCGGPGISMGLDFRNMRDNPGARNDHNIVRNCIINRSWRQGIIIARSGHNTLENNITLETSYGAYRGGERVAGAAIEITGMEGGKHLSVENVIRGNTVQRGYEGIGVYGQTSRATVENNTVFDCQTYYIYLSRTKDNVIRNNLVYSTGGPRVGTSRGAGVVLSVETDVYSESVTLGGNMIYGNYIAGNAWGIFLNIDGGSDYGRVGERIFNNRIVDCNRNFLIERDDSKWSDNFIYNNFSFLYEMAGLGVHSNRYNPVGIDWNFDLNGNSAPNHFRGGALPPTGTKARTGAMVNVNHLKKQTGWRNLNPGIVDKSIFSFVGESLKTENIKTELNQFPGRVGNFKIVNENK